MEVQHLDSNDVTLVAVLFSAMIGVILFITLLCKTGLAAMFKTKRTEKEAPFLRRIDNNSNLERE